MKFVSALAVTFVFLLTAGCHSASPGSSKATVRTSTPNLDRAIPQRTRTSIDQLNRKLSFSLADTESADKNRRLDLYFTVTVDGEAFYQGFASAMNPDHYWYGAWESGVFARVRQAESGFEMEVLFSDDDRFMVLELAPGSDSAKIKAQGEYKAGKGLQLPEGWVDYWYDYQVVSQEPGTELEVLSPLTSTPGETILESVVRVGPMDFSPCDGCEHGDQMFVRSASGQEPVNVIALLSEKYYTGDCPGNIHPAFEALLESQVPFTYEGRLSALWQDYSDGDYWVAPSGGKMTVGARGVLGIDELLDLVLDKTGTASVTFESELNGVSLKVLANGLVWTVDLVQGTISQDD